MRKAVVGDCSIASTAVARALKSGVMSPRRREERRQVAQQVHAGDPAQPGQHRRGAAPEHAHAQPGGPDERLQRAPLEERGQPPGGVEEVQSVA